MEVGKEEKKAKNEKRVMEKYIKDEGEKKE